MKKFATRVSLTDARTGKRLRLDALPAGAALVEPILGYCYQAGHLTVYVNGSMPLALRSAQEEGHTAAEMWLVDPLPTGIREIDWTDCRREFALLLPDNPQAA
jgi:hypothetical protein